MPRPLVLLFLAFAIVPELEASNVAFQTGDVIVGGLPGTLRHFSPTGAPLDTSLSGGTSYLTGMGFDAVGNLYVTGFNAQTVYKFDNTGTPQGTFGSGYNSDPESIVFARNGNAFVGQADGSHQLLEFSPTGSLIAAFSPAVDDRGTDWVDLASDQCTIFYTSEGSNVKRFDVCRNTQLADFATGLSGPCYAHRIRPNFEVLVACTTVVYRLDSSGSIIKIYTNFPGADLLFALNLDPDNKSFWTGDLTNGNVYRVDIATGNLLTSFNAGTGVAGMTVVGEITASGSAPPFATTSYYISTRKSQTLHDLGAALAQRQIATGSSQDNVVALLFGGPTYDVTTATYGASLWGHRSSVNDIASLVEAFIVGYYNAPGMTPNLHVRIVLATSNNGGNVNTNHGQAWAQMINDVAAWVISQRYSGQVDIAGGSNIEMGFNRFPMTKTWIDGYASVMPNRFMYNVGAAEGCPRSGAGSCNNSWTVDNLWYVSWGSTPAIPLPEIYNAANAAQWTNVSLYGVNQYNESVISAGALTEFGACQQHPTDSTCLPAPFTPADGWNAFYTTLNGNASTAQTLPWSSDIKWQY